MGEVGVLCSVRWIRWGSERGLVGELGREAGERGHVPWGVGGALLPLARTALLNSEVA